MATQYFKRNLPLNLYREGKNLLRAPCSLGRKIYLVLCWKQVLSCIGGLLVNFWACLLDLPFPLCLFSLLNSVSSWTLPFKFVIPTIPTMFFFFFLAVPKLPWENNLHHQDKGLAHSRWSVIHVFVNKSKIKIKWFCESTWAWAWVSRLLKNLTCFYFSTVMGN